MASTWLLPVYLVTCQSLRQSAVTSSLQQLATGNITPHHLIVSDVKMWQVEFVLFGSTYGDEPVIISVTSLQC